MENNKNETKKTVWYKELIPYVVIIIVVILIRTFVFTPAVVDGPSMEPTLYNKQWLLVLKFTKIDYNDIIVFKYQDRYLVKRVIGKPKDSIKCEEGKIYINEKLLDDKYSIDNNICNDSYTLKEDEYFVLGDNREVSMDSRTIGPVKKDVIIGTTNFRIFPFNKIGIFNKK